MSNVLCDPVIFSDLGEAGILCAFPQGPLDLARQQKIWAVADGLSGMEGIAETMPGMNNLAVLFNPYLLPVDALKKRIEALWQAPATLERGGRLIEIPVVYGGPGGADLADLAQRAGMTPKTFAEIHAAGEYVVYALGSQPGFGYLGGLDPRLATPRRTVVNPSIPEGTVILGGSQTAVQARTTPSGWHRLGVTESSFFDPAQEQPALLAPGDRVRFTLVEVLP